jgi:hypothetical protein
MPSTTACRGPLLGDPAGFARRIEAVDEIGGDACHQRLEAPVPAVLAGVERAVAADHPADVAALRRPQQPGRSRGAVLAAEQLLDRPHRRQQLGPIGLAEGGEQAGDAVLAVLVERGEGALAGGSEAQVQVPGIVLGAHAPDQLAFLQAAQQPAEVARVEVEVAGKLGRGGPVAVREFPEQARFGQAEAGLGQPFLKHADAARVEAVEAADRGSGRLGGGRHAASGTRAT